MTQQLVTMNVSVEQIEKDLRSGKSIEEIAQDWSEPRANVYAVKRAMDAAAASPRPAPVTPLPSVPRRPEPAVTVTLDLVEQGSKSRSARTRALAAKLDTLVEELSARLA